MNIKKPETGKLGYKKPMICLLCIFAGVALYMAVEFSETESGFDGDTLKRNPWGSGDAVYHLLVGGVSEKEMAVDVAVAEQKFTKERADEIFPLAVELLCTRILGENSSLSEVREDLNLVTELSEYGLAVSWESDAPDIVSSMGLVNGQACREAGETVYLRALLSNGICEAEYEIPVTAFPRQKKGEEIFLSMLQEQSDLHPESGEVALPKEFGGKKLTYREKEETGNKLLLLLGPVLAVCLFLREKEQKKNEKKRREEGLLLDYPDVVSKFLVLSAAGFTVRQAWKKLVYDAKDIRKSGYHPVYEEMEIAMNQTETGVPEIKAYTDFGRRCGLRCYTKFASLLATCLQTGGRNLKKLLEEEMDEAFNLRKETAKRRGEEVSTKLLIPLFLMLGVVMVMVVAPAFLTLG